jgi:hypothetical protein
MTWLHALAALLLVTGSAGLLAFLRLAETAGDAPLEAPETARASAAGAAGELDDETGYRRAT